MKIICTLSYVLSNCNNWLDFCNDRGLDEYVCHYSGDSEVTLSEEQAIK